MSGDEETRGGGELPVAELKPERRLSLAWLVPLAAVVLAAWLVLAAWRERGFVVEVYLPDGHGLKVGDPARYRGITVGEVRALELGAEAESVLVSVGLHGRADRLARAGARFWVVRPRLGISRVEGLETLIGPRYLAVLPGPPDGRRQREFVGLAEPPVVDEIGPGDLEIILEGRRRGSVRPGAPVAYRQVRVGTVLSVGLASDGSRVEARVHIEQAYRALVREGTQFWDAGGLRTDLRLTGLSIELDSIEELVTGGVAFATPGTAEAGEAAHTGRRFTLNERPDDDWLEWEPAVAVGSSLLPPDVPLPQMLRATIAWRQGLVFKGSRSRRGWVLQTIAGLLGPADLLTAGEKADRETVSLEVAGAAVPLEGDPSWSKDDLARRAIDVSASVWPADRIRAATAPEDCIAVCDPAVHPIPLAASRLTVGGPGWIVDPAVSFDEDWHGAAVLSRADGRLVGILLIDDDEATVALLDE